MVIGFKFYYFFIIVSPYMSPKIPAKVFFKLEIPVSNSESVLVALAVGVAVVFEAAGVVSVPAAPAC